MFGRCSCRTVFVAMGLVLLGRYFFACDGTIIAKSKVTMCVRDRGTDPFNVVDGKKCNKKLVVTKAVTAGEGPSELIYVNISKVDDEVDRDQARLYNPFIVAITQSPMHLVYPYYYKGIVNNKPYETSKRHYWCKDGAGTEDDDDLSCTPLRDKTSGERIWDSQGFCCRCSMKEDATRGGGRRHHRGDAECGNALHIPLLSWLFFKNDDRQSSHCMHYDKLWYKIHEVGTYSLLFKIFIKAYDLVEEEKDGKVHRKLLDGGKISLSNFKKSGQGIYGRILATLVGTFEPNVQFSSLTEKYLMIPSEKSEVEWMKNPQTRGGVRDYMLVPKHYFAIDTPLLSCDKIGVSFTAFRQQGGHNGQGPGCTQRIGTCLNNQPKDIFGIDMKRREQGKRPHFFPDKFGELVGTQKFGSSGGHALVYKVNEKVASTVTLEISADDIILLYNRATGIIVKAFATDFESQSRDGGLHVIVQNTGLVTADFYLTVKYCTVGILRGLEKKASINPQSTHTFSMELTTTVHASRKFMCTVDLWDARHKFLDSANVSFQTTKTCVCLQSCSCACTGTADSEECVVRGTDTSDQVEFENIKLKKIMLGTLERFFQTVNDQLASLADHLLAKPTWERVFNVWIFLCLVFGLFKARLGAKPGGAPIAYFGWWWEQPTGTELFVDSEGCEILGNYNKDGELIDPATGKVLKSEKQLLFIGNILFFFLLICILGVRVARYYKELERRQELMSLSNVALSGTVVYRNFTNFPDATNYLTNPGTDFSLAGKLKRIKNIYKFTVEDEMQVIEIVDDELMLLTPAVPFDGDVFTKLYKEQEALGEVTLQPLYMCLNEEPKFDFYSDDEQPENLEAPASEHSLFSEPPPTPPIPDYSFHNFSNDGSVYEEPIHIPHQTNT